LPLSGQSTNDEAVAAVSVDWRLSKFLKNFWLLGARTVQAKLEMLDRA